MRTFAYESVWSYMCEYLGRAISMMNIYLGIYFSETQLIFLINLFVPKRAKSSIKSNLIFAKTSLHNIVSNFLISQNIFTYLGQFLATYSSSPSYKNVANILIVQPLPNYVVITKHDVNYNDKVILNNNIMAILKTNNIVPVQQFAIIRGIYIYF